MRWMRMVLLLGVVWLAMSVFCAGETPAGLFSSELDTELYDCELTLTPPADATGAVRLLLEQGDGPACTRLTITTTRLEIIAEHAAPAFPPVRLPLTTTPGAPFTLTVLRRGDALAVRQGDTVLFRGTFPRAAGANALVTADRGWTVEEPRVQRLEPVVFADNFMRGPNDPSHWTPQGGVWALQSVWDDTAHADRFIKYFADHAQNPFAWVGKNDGATPALCTSGVPSWEEYTMSAAVSPAPGGAVGVLVNMPDPANGLLVRWSVASDRGKDGDSLTVYRYAAGKLTPLAQSKGGYVPGHWYKLTVASELDELRVAIDGRQRLAVQNPTPWRGGVGLYAEGKNGAIFDDVTVYGRSFRKELLAESQSARVNESFRNDRMGVMQQWALAQNEWQRSAFDYGYWLHRREYYGDHWFALDLTPATTGAGTLMLALNADGRTKESGYRALIQRGYASSKTSYTLYRNADVLKKATGEPLQRGESYSIRFWHLGATLRLEVDGNTVVEATDAHPLTGLRAGYQADGAFTKTMETAGSRWLNWWNADRRPVEEYLEMPDALVLGRNLLDYTFTDAPVDWLAGQGTWLPTMRWACSEGWSFLGGWGRGDVALWHKQRFTGDQSFEAFLAVRMEYPRERQWYDDRYRDLGLTICGDGFNPRNGYAAILGAPDAQGHTNRRTVLLRNGAEVAAANIAIPDPGRESNGHREWFALELRKHGDTVEVWALGQRALSFRDPQPLDGGIPAIWTANNGIVVARARLAFANPPQTWQRPLVTISEPWYPEWADAGHPLALSFQGTWSATGKPVRLQVTPRETPTADRNAVTVAGPRATFAPTVVGDHWYEITATDGVNSSPAYHLDLPVFTPAIGRDDSHALVLYRFDEGKGDVVRDHSAVAPAVDLRVPQHGQWLRGGRGLTVTGPGPLKSTVNADKLLAIQQSKAATIEMWVSTESLYAEGTDTRNKSIRWYAPLLSWEGNVTRRNLTVGHQGEFFTFGGQSRTLAEYDKPFSCDGFRKGLQHLVVTWDGVTTRSYINGKLMLERKIPWRAETWESGNALLFGNRSDGRRAYLGGFYLAAIHNRCFPPEQVLRHYHAGPAAK